jgi:3,4-dihydroxy-2-butanone 4-phosphate synthase
MRQQNDLIKVGLYKVFDERENSPTLLSSASVSETHTLYAVMKESRLICRSVCRKNHRDLSLETLQGPVCELSVCLQTCHLK